MFELVEEALDPVALFVEGGVVGALIRAVALGRDDDLPSRLGDPLDEMIGVVSLVGNGGFGLDAVDELVREGDVVALPGRGNQANGKAQSLGGGVDLGAQAATRPAQTLGMRPPLWNGPPLSSTMTG